MSLKHFQIYSFSKNQKNIIKEIDYHKFVVLQNKVGQTLTFPLNGLNVLFSLRVKFKLINLFQK